jgi:hypothetical protein
LVQQKPKKEVKIIKKFEKSLDKLRAKAYNIIVRKRKYLQIMIIKEVLKMKFEVGKRYKDISGDGVAYEIIKRTAKTVTFVTIQHEGRSNERTSEQKRARICNWEQGEVFCNSYDTVASY